MRSWPRNAMWPGKSRGSGSLSATAVSISAGWSAWRIKVSKKTPGFCPRWSYPKPSATAAAANPWSIFRTSISRLNLNRVVIGACSPRTHEGLFQETVRKAGLNKYLVEIANLRDQDTWVHQDRPVVAAEKADELMRMAVSAVRLARPLADLNLPMNKDVLVVEGGGIAGMTASLRLAVLGYKVHLVERSRELGGVAKEDSPDPRGRRRPGPRRRSRQENHKTRADPGLEAIHGGGPLGHGRDVQDRYPGGPQMFYRELRHGITILAIGRFPTVPRSTSWDGIRR